MIQFSEIMAILPRVEFLFYHPGVVFPQKWGDFAADRVYDYIQIKPLRRLSIIAQTAAVSPE